MPSLPVNTSTDGQLLVAAPSAGQFIRVLGLDLTAAGDVDVSLKSNNSTVIWNTKAMANSSGAGGIVLPVSRDRDIDCENGQSLNLGLDAAVVVQGTIEYIVLGRPDNP